MPLPEGFDVNALSGDAWHGDPEQSLENEGMRRLALSILRHAEIVKRIEKEYENASA